jgi:hypothetical protein
MRMVRHPGPRHCGFLRQLRTELDAVRTGAGVESRSGAGPATGALSRIRVADPSTSPRDTSPYGHHSLISVTTLTVVPSASLPASA